MLSLLCQPFSIQFSTHAHTHTQIIDLMALTSREYSRHILYEYWKSLYLYLDVAILMTGNGLDIICDFAMTKAKTFMI